MNLITLGTYDGVHLGHRTLVKDLVSRARRLSMRSLVVLFPRPPRVHFHPELAVPLLTTPEERAARSRPSARTASSFRRSTAPWPAWRPSASSTTSW